MENLDATLDLPEFLDLILDYISTVLPPPIYNIFEYLLSQVYTLLCSLLTLSLTLSRSIINNAEGGHVLQRLERWWDSLDATEVIPPLLTLVAAYLALLSFYRTSKWMISMAIYLVKWGFILITLGTAAGWYLSSISGGGAEDGIARQWGVTQAVGGLVNQFLDGQAQKSSINSKSQVKRPVMYELRNTQQGWQDSETQSHSGGDALADARHVVSQILAGGGDWWKTLLGTSGERETRRQRRERAAQTLQ
ncbi:hypothetical protein BC629DRAFT_1438442 [Irpex lacteus]|nr:hypothetical protein BC629DRAFT_1438442 [Irpex lacteus]